MDHMSKQDQPRLVPIGLEERKRNCYSIPHLQTALEGLHQDGMVVLQGLVDSEHCDKLYEHMTGDRDRIMKELHSGGKAFNQGVNSNILQEPPYTRPELLFDDVHFNPFVIQVLNSYLGPKPRWIYTTGNNALAGTAGMRQPVHKDTRYRHPKCPFLVVCNTALNDFTIDNGATEFWLGTHAFTDETVQEVRSGGELPEGVLEGQPACSVLPEAVEARRLVRPPIRACMKKGDVMLRDIRTWHAGMPNNTSRDRIMIAQTWMASWYPNYAMHLNLPRSQSEYFLGNSRRHSMELVAEFLSDKEVEDSQHRDILRYGPTHFLEYYDNTSRNYEYGYGY